MPHYRFITTKERTGGSVFARTRRSLFIARCRVGNVPENKRSVFGRTRLPTRRFSLRVADVHVNSDTLPRLPMPGFCTTGRLGQLPELCRYLGSVERGERNVSLENICLIAAGWK